MRRNFIVVSAAALGVLMFAACSSSGGGDKVSVSGSAPTTAAGTAPVASSVKGNTATIDTNMGTIVVELDRAHAPKAAGHFADLAASGFYNHLTFHRVVPDFVIQGGDPKGDGTGGSGKPPVAGETPNDGYPIGSLAAAKTGNDPPGTFDCQFFIVTGQQGTQLPNDYARFGKVVKGMDVAKRIEALAPPEGDGPPTQKVVINKITIS